MSSIAIVARSSLCFSPRFYNSLNLWGNFRLCFYKSTRKTNNHVHKIFNAQVPSEKTYDLKDKDVKPTNSIAERLATASPEEIQNDPELLNELGKQYEATRTDPDHIEATEFCMRIMQARLSGKYDWTNDGRAILCCLSQLNLLSRELTSERVTLVNRLIQDLSKADICYVRTYSSYQIEQVGSQEIHSVYSKINGILFKALFDNEELTHRYNQNPIDSISASSGELSSIIAIYKDKLIKPMEVLNSYLLSQSGSKQLRSEVRGLFDDFISVTGLRVM